MADICDELKEEWMYLKRTWENTRNLWRDKVAEDFERRMWSQWEQEVPPTLDKMQELEELLYRIKADIH